ncbi:MAG: ubiquinol-cytochrome c reductase iron-sulfur subunit [Anaerolineae bacterium]|nr:ubiquinol-cytochrome c reductase iron-sulfur subunit [Anaerolineae bacterium]
MTQISRRDFLKLVRDGFLYLSGALATGGLLRFLSYAPASEQKTEFDLGSVDDYPVGSRTSIPEISALLIHTENGFTALSLTCTHLGCTLEPVSNGFACPCHNSAFDAEGNVTQGPAVKPLRALRIEITAENKLIVFTD